MKDWKQQKRTSTGLGHFTLLLGFLCSSCLGDFLSELSEALINLINFLKTAQNLHKKLQKMDNLC